MSWERWAAAGGMVFVALVLVTQFGFGAPPSDGQGVITFYHDHHDATLVRQLLAGLGGAAFLFFAGALTAALRRDEGSSTWASSATLAAAVTATAIAFVQAIVVYALATRTPSDAGVADAMQNLATVSGRFLSLPLAVFLASASAAIMSGRTLPAWLSWLGLLAAAVNLLSSLRIAVDIGGPLGSVALLLLAIWILSASVLLVFRRSTAMEGG